MLQPFVSLSVKYIDMNIPQLINCLQNLWGCNVSVSRHYEGSIVWVMAGREGSEDEDKFVFSGARVFEEEVIGDLYDFILMFEPEQSFGDDFSERGSERSISKTEPSAGNTTETHID